MGGRIVDLLSSPHSAAEALMPWLLNGTLAPAERRQLEEHLESCAQCRDELAGQRELMTLYAASPVPIAEDGGASALARLLARLPSVTATDAAAPRRGAGVMSRWWHIGVAVQMGVIVALGWTVWLLQPAAAPSDGAPAAYSGLAAREAPRSAGDAVVIIDPGASEADLRRALQRAGARIIDGPTAAGAYVLRFERQDSGEAIAALRSERAVKRVETLSAGNR